MRFSFPFTSFADVFIDAEKRVAELEPSEEQMRKRGFVLVRRKSGTAHYRRLPIKPDTKAHFGYSRAKP